MTSGRSQTTATRNFGWEPLSSRTSSLANSAAVRGLVWTSPHLWRMRFIMKHSIWWWWWWWLSTCIAHYAERLYCACPGALWKKCLQCWSKRSDVERWITQTIRQQVPDHPTCHGKCPTSEPTATITWYDQLMASGRSETHSIKYGHSTIQKMLKKQSNQRTRTVCISISLTLYFATID